MNVATTTILELCAGVGMLGEGIAAGLRHLGRTPRVVGYVERDAYAAAVLLARMASKALEPAPVWAGNLEDVRWEKWAGAVDCREMGEGMNIKELIADLQLHFPASDPKEIAKALLAQQVVIERMVSLVRQAHDLSLDDSDFAARQTLNSALALQPDLSALREHDAEVVNKASLLIADPIVRATLNNHAERIRKGE